MASASGAANSSSPIPRPRPISILNRLLELLDELAAATSFQESYTKMEVLTSIVSSYLMSNFTLGIQGRSMLTGLTPILNRYALHLERLTTTPPSLETFASTTFTMTISNQRSNRATGMKSLLVSLENDFSNYCVSGIRACLSQLSNISKYADWAYRIEQDEYQSPVQYSEVNEWVGEELGVV